jgi:hypothetical protein
VKDEMNAKPESRRQFFLAVGRYLGLGGLGSLAAFQGIKGRRLEREGNCIQIVICRDCGAFQGCRKTKAEQFRAG